MAWGAVMKNVESELIKKNVGRLNLAVRSVTHTQFVTTRFQAPTTSAQPNKFVSGRQCFFTFYASVSIVEI